MGVLARNITGVLALLVLSSVACAADETVRAEMTNEDSHPHEVQPGAAARFFIAPGKGGRLDVKCALSGPVGPVRLIFQGVAPLGWAASNAKFQIKRAELHVDIEGIVTPGGTAHFEFVNDDPTRLLWHQCYNN